jgi:hypothetical protein
MKKFTAILVLTALAALLLWAGTLAGENCDAIGTGDLGANWSLANSALRMPRCYNSGFAATVSYENEAARETGRTWPNDQWAQMRQVENGSGRMNYVTVRSGASNSGYVAGIDGYRYNDYYGIRKSFAGGNEICSTSIDPVTNDVVRLEAQASSVTLKVNDSTICGPTTNSVFAGGEPGFALYHPDTTTIRADDWQAGDFGSGTRRRQPIVASWALVPRAYAQESAFARLYFVPSDALTTIKYRDQLCAVRCEMMAYGPEPHALVLGWMDATRDAAVTANTDVRALPACAVGDAQCGALDAHLSAGAVTQIQSYLEARNIPADWVTTAYSWRQVVRVVAQFFQFAQRYENISGSARLFPAGVTLADTVGQMDATTRGFWQQTAASLGYSFEGVTSASTVRYALKTLGQQWGARPIYLGGLTL